MNGVAVNPAGTGNPGLNGASQQLATDINSYRIGVVAEKLANYAQSFALHKDNNPQYFFQLCLSLARELDEIVEEAIDKDIRAGNSMPLVQRGIDYGVANNEPPVLASKLPPILKQVCRRRTELFLQAAIMVLMISVKNACKLGWFSAKDTEELLTLADEVGNCFGTRRDIESEACGFMPTLSTVMSRFYPQYRLGHIVASLEAEPGYGTYLVDFHITRNISISKDERIRLLVAMKDNVDSSSCIISPQQVSILLNGKPVDKRTNVVMDQGPQAPTIVNQWLKYGTNLLQAVGQFNGHYIIIIAAMSVLPSSDLPVPQDYVQPDTTAVSSGSDSELIEGPSRITLNCPISYKRIRTPVKGHLCKHYQCFDLNNYVEINLKRPYWRCPSCNQSVCFTDLRVDQKMAKVLQEVGENVSEVVFSADGSWTAASSSNCNETSNQQEGIDREESSVKSDAPSNVHDLTGEDDVMDTTDRCEPVDMKPIINHNLQGQSAFINSTPPAIPRSNNELNQFSSAQISGTLSYDPGTSCYTVRSEALAVGGISGASTSNFAVAPVLTDAVSPALNRMPDTFQRSNYPTNSIALSQVSASSNAQLQEVLYGRSPIPRFVNRDPSAIQALPVQMPTGSPQHYARPTVSVSAASRSSVPFQMPTVALNAQVASTVSSNIERQRHFHQSHVNSLHVSNMSTTPPQNRAASQGVGLPTPSHNLWMPPHLMRSSQLPRNNVQQGVSSGGGISNSPSTVQRVQLTPQQAAQMRLQPILSQQAAQMRQHATPQQAAQMRQHATMPLQTQSVRMPSSLPSNPGAVPQAVSRTENLIDLQEQQSWRPTGRMRGALTGQAYSAALSQYLAPTQTSSPRPSTPGPSSTPPNLQQVLLANRMIAQATQGHNLPESDAANATGTTGNQEGHPEGVN